ncbi:MAG TPA: hypothetical protein VH678_12960 [Xanthobacteraceae bacterium]|jgi:hypothetical protein
MGHTASDQQVEQERFMVFKPNYGRDRAERQKAARARSEEKQRKKEEKTAQRKAERSAADPLPNDKKE